MRPLTIDWLQSILLDLAVPVGTSLGIAIALLLVRRYLLRWLEALARRTTTLVDGLVVDSLRTPTLLWSLAIALAAGLETASLPRRLAAWGTSIVAAMVILSIT